MDYNYDTQKLYLEMMLMDSTTFIRCQSIFDHTLFDKKLKKSAEFIHEYVKNYNTIPTTTIINASTNSNFLPIPDLTNEHFNWLLDEFEKFTRHKSMEKAIEESVEFLEKYDYASMETTIKKASEISLQKDLGTNYFKNPKERLEKIKSTNGQLSTGWKDLDILLYGGFNRGELELFLAQSGGGKSLFLANLAVNYTQMLKKNVVYITLELKEELVSMRIDSMLTNTNAKDVFKSIDNIHNSVKNLKSSSGKLQVKYLPSGTNTNTIKAYLKEYEIKTNSKVDVLLVDYMDLMAPNSKKIDASKLDIFDKYISEELRNLAIEKNILLISCSQLNRGAITETEFDHSHIAGGMGKIRTADNVLAIYINKSLRERGIYQLQFMKTRNSSGVGQSINLDFNTNTLRISDSTQPTTSLLNDIKSRSTTTTSIQTNNKVRELLNNINITD